MEKVCENKKKKAHLKLVASCYYGSFSMESVSIWSYSIGQWRNKREPPPKKKAEDRNKWTHSTITWLHDSGGGQRHVEAIS